MSVRASSLVLCGVLLVSIAWIGRATPLPARAADAQTIRIGSIRQPATIDPMRGGQYIENYIDEALFDGLTVIDDRGRVVPDLALAVPTRRNGGISRDGRTLTYRLRPNLVWSDGVPLTARDVAFTFALLRAPATNFPSRSTYDIVDRVDAADARTVRVRLHAPDADAVAEIFVNGQNGSIVPEHLLRGVRDLMHDPFDTHPIGSGPYVLERWDRGTAISFRANPRYVRGAPKTPAISMAFFGDANTLGLEMRTGAIDFAQIPPALVPQFGPATTGIALRSASSTTLAEIQFNVRAAPVDDGRVRRALGLALDRARIAATIFHGQADVANGLLPPNSIFARANGASALAADPAGSAALLDAAGWRAGPDGMRSRGGMPLQFSLIVPSANPTYLGLAVQLQAAWRALGADVSVNAQLNDVLRAPDGPLARGRFQAVVSPFGYPVTPDRTQFITTGAFPPYGYNYMRYADATVDRDSVAARVETDPAKRKRLLGSVESRIRADAPIVPIVWTRYAYVLRDGLRGVRPEPVNSDLWNVYDWTLAR